MRLILIHVSFAQHLSITEQHHTLASVYAEACAVECKHQHVRTVATNYNTKHGGDSVTSTCTVSATCERTTPTNRAECTDEIAVDCEAGAACAKPDIASEENATAVMSPRADDNIEAASLHDEMPWLSKPKRR